MPAIVLFVPSNKLVPSVAQTSRLLCFQCPNKQPLNPLLPNGKNSYCIAKISFLKNKRSWEKIPTNAACMSR